MSRAEASPVALYHRVVVYLLFAILVLPLMGTLVYSLASSCSTRPLRPPTWQKTRCPSPLPCAC